MKSALEVLNEVRARVFEPKDESNLPDWIYGNVLMRGSPIGSRFDIEATPWLRAPMEALCDPLTREVVISSGAQLGKSTIACGFATYALAEHSKSVIVVLDTQAQSDIFNQTKLFPMVKSSAKVLAKLPPGKEATLKSRIHLDNADLLTGPANNSFLRSHSAPVVIGDEVSKWESGAIHNARARTRQFSRSQCLFTSTPLFEESDFGQAWMAGTRERWAHQCQGCGELFIPVMSTLKWDKGASKGTDKSNEARDMPRIKESLRMVCPICLHKHTQTPKEVKMMNEGGGYISENPNVMDKRVRSFMFSSLSLPERLMSWFDLVSEFLNAKDSIATGFDAPLKEFINLQLGEFWRGAGAYADDFQFVKGRGEMTGNKYRVASIDVQRDLTDFYIVIRDWAPNGDSRLVKFANVGSFQELDDILKEHKVEPNHVMIDCAYQTARVVQESEPRGWVPIRGTTKLHFLHKVGKRKTSRTIRRLYSPAVRMSHIPTNKGKVYYCVELATDPLRDLFVNLRDGRSKIKWEAGLEVVGDMAEDYIKQITSMRRVVKAPVGGTRRSVWTNTYAHDHAFDCEVYQVAGALLLRLPFSRNMEVCKDKE